MGDVVDLTTCARQGKRFYQVTTSAISFEVSATESAAIGLSRSPSMKADIVIILGDKFNTHVTIRHSDSEPSSASTPRILAGNEFRKFWLTWDSGIVELGRYGEHSPIISYKYSKHKKIDLFYVCFFVFGAHDPAHWRFELPPTRLRYKFKPVKGGSTNWVDASNELPERALIGGHENEILYIMRAEHENSMTPGKYVPSEGVGYISWGGTSHAKPNCQVLCGFNCIWVPTTDNRIPKGSIVAGHTESNGECLYIGRALHEEHLIPGKVKPADRCCYISYGGREVAVKKYEILVDPDSDFHRYPDLYPDSDEDGEFFEDEDEDEGDEYQDLLGIINAAREREDRLFNNM